MINRLLPRARALPRLFTTSSARLFSSSASRHATWGFIGLGQMGMLIPLLAAIGH